MRYQTDDVTEIEAADPARARSGPADVQSRPGNARTIQWTIVVGLLAAVCAAVFGHY